MKVKYSECKPVEMAQLIFLEYRFILSLPSAPLGEMKDTIAKKCALLLVDRIIEYTEDGEAINYWTIVKNVIMNF